MQDRREKRYGAYSLVEMMLAMAILGILLAIAIPGYVGYQEKGRREQAILDMRGMEFHLRNFRSEYGALPIDLADAVQDIPTDPWGNPYQYLNLEAGLPGTNGKRRRDKNMNPINSDFDLYSPGPDGQSQAQLVAAKARDDIVRAANGSFFGVAEDF